MGNQTEYKKSVLMFCANFFGYDKRIARALQDEGYAVDLFDERPGNGFVAKTCIRYRVSLYRPVIKRYIQSVIQQAGDRQYDYVLVVKGEGITEQAIAMLRAAYPEAKFVLYLWDSAANIPQCEERMKLYDRVLTFDPADAEKYAIPHLSIPYGMEYMQREEADRQDYDVAFIGTAHSVRPRVVKQIEQLCREHGRSCFVYFYSPHILVFLLNKLTNRDYRWIKKKDVHFKALSSRQVRDIYSRSKCVLDIEHPKQQGMTTRAVEMLALNKKIMTTNTRVQDAPFYHPNNICLIDRDNPQLDISFLDAPYVPVSEDVLEQYSPGRFARELMGEANV